MAHRMCPCLVFKSSLHSFYWVSIVLLKCRGLRSGNQAIYFRLQHISSGTTGKHGAFAQARTRQILKLSGKANVARITEKIVKAVILKSIHGSCCLQVVENQIQQIHSWACLRNDCQCKNLSLSRQNTQGMQEWYMNFRKTCISFLFHFKIIYIRSSDSQNDLFSETMLKSFQVKNLPML